MIAIFVYDHLCTSGKVVDTKTKSFETVKQGIAEVLMPVKMYFCLSVAKQAVPFQAFLTMYQTDKTMAPLSMQTCLRC